MQYRGKSIEIIGKRQMFDKTFCWIHILENDEFKQVMTDEIEEYHAEYYADEEEDPADEGEVG